VLLEAAQKLEKADGATSPRPDDLDELRGEAERIRAALTLADK